MKALGRTARASNMLTAVVLMVLAAVGVAGACCWTREAVVLAVLAAVGLAGACWEKIEKIVIGLVIGDGISTFLGTSQT